MQYKLTQPVTPAASLNVNALSLIGEVVNRLNGSGNKTTVLAGETLTRRNLLLVWYCGLVTSKMPPPPTPEKKNPPTGKGWSC